MKELYRKLIRGEELNLEEASLLGNITRIRLDFPIKYCIRGDQYLGSGVYRESKTISPIITPKMNMVAKLNGYHFIEEEREKIERAVENNVPIINFYEIANVYNLIEKKFTPGIILERIYGETICELQDSSSKYFKKAKEIWKRRIKQTERKKIITSDTHNENAMLDLQTQKLVLLDPVGWTFVD